VKLSSFPILNQDNPVSLVFDDQFLFFLPAVFLHDLFRDVDHVAMGGGFHEFSCFFLHFCFRTYGRTYVRMYVLKVNSYRKYIPE